MELTTNNTHLSKLFLYIGYILLAMSLLGIFYSIFTSTNYILDILKYGILGFGLISISKGNFQKQK